MPSAALAEWDSARRARVHELYAAHVAIVGSGRGRRKATEQINWAIALRLAAEFQGFVRDLHDEAVAAFLPHTYSVTAGHETAIRNMLLLSRQIDQKNATPSTLQQDFSRLGFLILDEVKRNNARGSDWLTILETLNLARNGVAHSNPVKMRSAAGGPTLQLSRVRRWDSALNNLARACDRATAENLVKLTGGAQPW